MTKSKFYVVTALVAIALCFIAFAPVISIAETTEFVQNKPNKLDSHKILLDQEKAENVLRVHDSRAWYHKVYGYVQGFFSPKLLRPSNRVKFTQNRVKVVDTFLNVSSVDANKPIVKRHGIIEKRPERMALNELLTWEKSLVLPELSRTTATEVDISAWRYCPPAPRDPSPADGSYVPNGQFSLIWGYDSPVPLKFDLYFEENNPNPQTLLARGLDHNYYNIGPLNEGSTYYWYVIAYDPNEWCPAASPIWHFTIQSGGPTATPYHTPSPTMTPTPVGSYTPPPTDTPVETNTQPGTSTPTPSPTSTPPPAQGRPFVLLGGYFETYLSVANDGVLNLVALVSDADNDVQRVELFYENQPVGVDLYDNGQSDDFGSGDGIYGLSVPVSGSDLTNQLQVVLEIVITDSMGNRSDVWPYLNIQNQNRAATSTAPQTAIEKKLTRKMNRVTTENNFLKIMQQYIHNGQSAEHRSAQAANIPKIALAGYWNTDVGPSNPGEIQVMAYVMAANPAQPVPMQTVELYFNGQPTGALLADDGMQGDLGPGDSVFGMKIPVSATDLQGIAGQRFLLEIRATDYNGLASDLWPWLLIHK